jgi:hypothetical protein
MQRSFGWGESGLFFCSFIFLFYAFYAFLLGVFPKRRVSVIWRQGWAFLLSFLDWERKVRGALFLAFYLDWDRGMCTGKGFLFFIRMGLSRSFSDVFAYWLLRSPLWKRSLIGA